MKLLLEIVYCSVLIERESLIVKYVLWESYANIDLYANQLQVNVRKIRRRDTIPIQLQAKLKVMIISITRRL